MRICLVRCPSPFLIDERAFPPLGLLAVGTALRIRGHDVCIHDDTIDSIPAGFHCYGFGASSPEYLSALRARDDIRQNTPGARIIIGGPHVTLNYQDCLKDGWDCIVVGDGDLVAEEACVGQSSLLVAPAGFLDDYPIPDRTLIDLTKYHYTLNGRPATTLVTSKGCPFHCAFCCKNHGNVRLRSAPKVCEEIRLLHYDYGYKALAFPEDIFILDRSRTEGVCKCLKQLGIIWRCLIRADILVRYGQEFVRMMADAGCVDAGMGIESGSDTILKNVNKGETVATMREAIRMLKAEGIRVKGFFILGLPGETKETMAETETFIAESQLDDLDCKIYQPYSGSPIVNNPERYDIHWSVSPLDKTFYKGRFGEYHGSISTSKLTTAEIVEAWKGIETRHKTCRA
jgi:anaerobic magnesium-protoporphyrin IX monomethyl ester cyclase